LVSRIITGQQGTYRHLTPRAAPLLADSGLIKAYRGFGETVLGRGVTFGVYAEVVAPGRIRVGDEIELDVDRFGTAPGPR